MKWYNRGIYQLFRCKSQNIIETILFSIILFSLIFVWMFSDISNILTNMINDEISTPLILELKQNPNDNTYKFADVKKNIDNNDDISYFDYNTLVDNVYSTDVEPYVGETDNYFTLPEEFKDIQMSLVGVEYLPLVDLEEDRIEIIEGTVFEENSIDEEIEIIVSAKLAAKNNLAINNILTLKKEDINTKSVTQIESKIVGIYDYTDKYNRTEELTKNENKSEYINAQRIQYENNVYIKNSSAQYLLGQEDIGRATIYLYLKDNRAMEKIFPEVQELLSEYGELKIADQQSFNVLQSLENISNTSYTFSLLWSIFFIAIIILIQCFFLQPRKKELAIYMSLGEAKKKIIFQLIVELSAKLFVAILICFPLFQIFSNKIKNDLLLNELISRLDIEQRYMGMGYFVKDFLEINEMEKKIGMLNVDLSMYYSIISVIICATFISAIFFIIYLSHNSPKKNLLD